MLRYYEHTYKGHTTILVSSIRSGVSFWTGFAFLIKGDVQDLKPEVLHYCLHLCSLNARTRWGLPNTQKQFQSS